MKSAFIVALQRFPLQVHILLLLALPSSAFRFKKLPQWRPHSNGSETWYKVETSGCPKRLRTFDTWTSRIVFRWRQLKAALSFLIFFTMYLESFRLGNGVRRSGGSECQVLRLRFEGMCVSSCMKFSSIFRSSLNKFLFVRQISIAIDTLARLVETNFCLLFWIDDKSVWSTSVMHRWMDVNVRYKHNVGLVDMLHDKSGKLEKFSQLFVEKGFEDLFVVSRLFCDDVSLVFRSLPIAHIFTRLRRLNRNKQKQSQ